MKTLNLEFVVYKKEYIILLDGKICDFKKSKKKSNNCTLLSNRK